MSTKFHYHPRNIDVDQTKVPLWLYNEIAGYRGRINRSDAPVFTCLGNGKPMLIFQHQSGRYFARHFNGDNPYGHSHAISTGMSDEHRIQTEYVHRAATQHGLDAEYEKSTGNGTILDLAVFGTHQTGFEIQRSKLSCVKAKARAFKSYEAGWPTAWITDQEKLPEWTNHVPSARLTVRGWESLPPANTVNVVIGDYSRERDHTQSTGWRYVRQVKQVLLDELSYLMPAGEIIPVVGTQGLVDLAYANAADIIDSCTSPGTSTWKPDIETPAHKQKPQTISRDCSHPEQETETCCWDATGQFCSCWKCVQQAIAETLPDQLEAIAYPRRCPGCDGMHTVKPCFPGCNDMTTVRYG